MPQMNIIQAVNDALKLEMRRDKRVVILGEDVGKFGGVFRATSGLFEEFGGDRVMDTPLAEAGIIGCAIGMALYGLRPVPEIQFADFIYPAFDQIVNELAKYRYRSGGQYTAPVVIRTPCGGGIRVATSLAVARGVLRAHPGAQVVMPSNPVDAKGLLLASIRQNDPVLSWSQAGLSRLARRCPSRAIRDPLGKPRSSARARRSPHRLERHGAHGDRGRGEAAAEDRRRGHRPPHIVPFDIETLVESVTKTGRR